MSLPDFDITNTELLLKKISAEDLKVFNFDIKCIDWPYYFSTVHIQKKEISYRVPVSYNPLIKSSDHNSIMVIIYKILDPKHPASPHNHSDTEFQTIYIKIKMQTVGVYIVIIFNFNFSIIYS